jgi:predicted porin
MGLKTKLSCIAAVACASVNAHAQSSVTLYGVIDGTVEAVRTTGANKTGANVPMTVREDSNSWAMA